MFFKLSEKRRATARASATSTAPSSKSENRDEPPLPYQLKKFCPSPGAPTNLSTHSKKTRSPNIAPYDLKSRHKDRLKYFLAIKHNNHQYQVKILKSKQALEVLDLEMAYLTLWGQATEMAHKLASDGMPFGDVGAKLESVDEEELKGMRYKDIMAKLRSLDGEEKGAPGQ